MGLVENIGLLDEAYNENEIRDKVKKSINRLYLTGSAIGIGLGVITSYFVTKYNPVMDLVNYISNLTK